MDDLYPDMQTGTNTAKPETCLTPAARQYLNQTRPWARFMSVLAFVAAGFIALMGLVLILTGFAGGFLAPGTGKLGALGSAVRGIPLGLFYLVSAVLYIPPGLFLGRYASSIASLEANPSSEGLENALKQQKSFWRYAGILTLVGIILTVVAIALMLLFTILFVRMK